VPARSWSQLDLSAETRIPPEGLHAITVLTEASTPVVVGRVVTVVGPRKEPTTDGITPRPAIQGGTTIGTATPVAARLWAATGLSLYGADVNLVAIHNPTDDTVRVTVTVIGGSGDGTVLADAVEVAPHDSTAVSTEGKKLGDKEITALVEATGPVVVERTITFVGENDFSMGLAVPLPTERFGLTPIGR
jgi:hypothetical protein